MQVKINQKKYTVPELTFEHYTMMEEQGFSIVNAFHKEQYMLLAMGFTCVVAEVDRVDAEYLLTQHVLGGGSVRDIVKVFMEAINQSDFFMKMLGLKVKTEDQEPAESVEKTESAEEENKSE